MNYKLQNRYQDSGWKDLGIEFEFCDDAICEASKLSRDAICYGMVRVIFGDVIIITCAAGHE